MLVRQRLTTLQLRLAAIQRFIGPIQQYKSTQVAEVNTKITEIISKTAKDVQRKFQKLKKVIKNYPISIDILPSQDKLNIVTQQLEELKEISLELDKIEKLLPVLKNQNMHEMQKKYQHIEDLLTNSQVKLDTNNHIQLVRQSSQTLNNLQIAHREQMNAIFQLNNRIISNLNNKLQVLNMKVNALN